MHARQTPLLCAHPNPKTGIPKPIVDLRLLEKFVNLFSFGFLRPTHSVPQAGLELICLRLSDTPSVSAC